VTKLRSANVRRGRSQSQADLHFSSKCSTSRQSQLQRNSLSGLFDISNSPSPSILIPSPNDHNTPISATTTALMMINKQYSNTPSPCLPPIANHQQHNTKNMPFYQKRYSNHI